MPHAFSAVLLPLLASLGLALEPFAILSSQQAELHLFFWMLLSLCSLL